MKKYILAALFCILAAGTVFISLKAREIEPAQIDMGKIAVTNNPETNASSATTTETGAIAQTNESETKEKININGDGSADSETQITEQERAAADPMETEMVKLADLSTNVITNEKVSLSVPFIIEIPDGTWTGYWKNACEEASMSMVNQYYRGVASVSRAASKNLMIPLFTYQNSIWGSNADSNATRTAKIINNNLDYTATIVDNPTIEQIKNELRAGRPVISFHYAKNLYNPSHRFRVDGSYFHVMVISGFDDATREFITEDPGAENGLDYRYKYDTLMSTLGDFDYTTHKVDGPARVIFTTQYLLAKAEGGSRIYLVQNNIKQYICRPDLFVKHGWKWSKVRTVNKDWLSSLASGPTICE
jgi:hypothetical protein